MDVGANEADNASLPLVHTDSDETGRVWDTVQESVETPSSCSTSTTSETHSATPELPPEIWAEIFSYQEDGDTFRPDCAPLLHAQVCRHWRAICLSTPRLWSSLTIHFHRRNSDSQLALTKLYLERSREHPLSIELHIGRDSKDRSFVEALIPHSHRWLNVELMMPWSSVDLLDSVRDRIPILRKLHVFPHPLDPWVSTTDAFTNAPSLRYFTIYDEGIWGLVRVPWSQLIHLEMRSFSLDIFMEALRMAPALREYVCYNMTVLTGQMIADVIARPVHHLALRSLRLWVEGNHIAVLFDSLSLPNLRVLVLHQRTASTRESTLHRIGLFLRRSQCSLETLSITGLQKYSIEDLLTCLESCPDLLDLSLEEPAVRGVLDITLVHRLTMRAGQQPLVPNLRTLHLTGPLVFPDDSFVDMVSSRRGVAGSLRSVSLHLYKRVMDAPAFDRLMSLRSGGLKVSVV
ncbi:hypothetical protein PLICRDRAFT_286421 [Plicaturopsis crispa FD-325 SS-3]|nr:hypothetical protein PLICRDRAFT_286421 [Plicaturopsis crispa FD-325 SS-3]